jgi:hypothetical protein
MPAIEKTHPIPGNTRAILSTTDFRAEKSCATCAMLRAGKVGEQWPVGNKKIPTPRAF